MSGVVVEATVFGEWLRAELRKRRMSQVELAEAVGAERSGVSLWVSGKRKPYPASAQRIADAFNLPRNEVLGLLGYGEDEPEADKARIIAKVKAVKLNPDRIAFLNGLLDSAIDMDRKEEEPDSLADAG